MVKMGGKQVVMFSVNDQFSCFYYFSFSNDVQIVYIYKVGLYVLGDYFFMVSGMVNGCKIMVKVNVILMLGSMIIVDVGLLILIFIVVGLSGVMVYVGGDKVGMIGDSGSLEFKDYLVSGNISVYLIVNVSGKIYEFKYVMIGKDFDYDNQIVLIFIGMIFKDDVDILMKDVYLEVLIVCDSIDDSILVDYFKDGVSNEYYQQLIKMVNGYSGNDLIDSYDYEVWVNLVVLVGDN